MVDDFNFHLGKKNLDLVMDAKKHFATSGKDTTRFPKNRYALIYRMFTDKVWLHYNYMPSNALFLVLPPEGSKPRDQLQTLLILTGTLLKGLDPDYKGFSSARHSNYTFQW